MAVMSLRKMIGRLSIKGDQYSLTIKLFFFSNPVFKRQSKYWVADIRVPHFNVEICNTSRPPADGCFFLYLLFSQRPHIDLLEEASY